MLTSALSSRILGIDLGSTSTRAFVFCPSADYEIYVENKGRNNLNTRYENGDFSSNGYPFDDGEVYLGDNPDPERRLISLKYGFYLLANAKDELLEQYPLVNPLMERQNDPNFRARLVEGLKQLFTKIRPHVLRICEKKRFTIDKIALSIPAQWTLEFEDVYTDIIVEVFSQPRSKLWFYTETEALAHFLFRNHMDGLEFEGDHEVMLFLDFGGHNMVWSPSLTRCSLWRDIHANVDMRRQTGCIFNVVRSSDDKTGFYCIEEPFGKPDYPSTSSALGSADDWERCWWRVGNLGASRRPVLRRQGRAGTRTQAQCLELAGRS